MKMNPKRPPAGELEHKTRALKENLLYFAAWFSSAFHDQTGDRDEDFEDSIIQTLALANMAMIEALSVSYGRRIPAHHLLTPVIEQTLTHERAQKNCPHHGNPTHNCGDHQ